MSASDLSFVLSIRPGGGGAYLADATLRAGERATPTTLARGVPITIDGAALLAAALDPREYGRRLSAMLFHGAGLGEAWRRVRDVLEWADRPLRFHLALAPDLALNQIRWETLLDPLDGRPITISQRLIFSRLLDTDAVLPPPEARPWPLRALVALACPRNLPARLPPYDVAGERARAVAALDMIEATVLGAGLGAPAAGLAQIEGALRAESFQILYLVCHGVQLDDKTVLFLEREDGAAQPLGAGRLVSALADLPRSRRPSLVVLGSCLSAGDPYGDTTGALGPLLARAGIPAVVAMQGYVPVQLVERLMPAFFAALRDGGVVDRALALARAALDEESDWWLPVLYSSLGDGRIWTAGPAAGAALHSSLQPTLGSLRRAVERARAEGQVFNAYKQLHDLLHRLLYTYGVIETDVVPRFPEGRESLRGHARDVEDYTRRMQLLAETRPELAEEAGWVADLQEVAAQLREARATGDRDLLEAACDQIDRTLHKQLGAIDARLKNTAANLRLPALLAEVRAARATIERAASARPGLVAEFLGLVGLLEGLERQLHTLVESHGTWQDVQLRLRTLRVQGTSRQLQIQWAWFTRRTRPLLERDQSAWLREFAAASLALDAVVAAFESWGSDRIEQIEALVDPFDTYVRQAELCFFQVDSELKDFCRRLSDTVGSLATTLSALVAAP
ncbi:MAG TPA: CHAT domain-containing protein [Chloroflexaceae bacterium]|nr:CHAT domain-containing protein [Chloroflexaceae bacterium]